MKKNLLFIVLVIFSAFGFSQTLVKDIAPGTNNSGIQNCAALGNITLFIATDNTNGWELWKTDGTTLGTSMVMDINPGAAHALAYYDGVYFNFSPLVTMNGKVYFFADDNSSGIELWSSDGTAAGTAMVKDIYPGSGSSNPMMYSEIIAVGNTLFFPAQDATGNLELWKSDGTAGGTVIVKNINPSAGSNPSVFFANGSRIYFRADDGVDGIELWTSDGTTLGTMMVADINPGSVGSYPHQFVAWGNKTYFSASTVTAGQELWVTDGTNGGTAIVKDIYPGNVSGFYSKAIFYNNQLLFSASDGTSGYELWKSDGTAPGTQLLKNIYPGSNDSNPYQLTEVNGKLIFSANDGTHGSELWISDGTTLGTSLILDINNVASQPSDPGWLTAANGNLYFSATDGTNGYELWKTDGTAGGTAMLNQICPGSCAAYPSYLFQNGNTLFFEAQEPNTGNELYKLDLPGTGVNEILLSKSYCLYPNPLVNGNWQLEVGDNLIGGKVEILDADGRVVYSSVIEKNKTEISANLPQGVYFLRLNCLKEISTQKLVKL